MEKKLIRDVNNACIVYTQLLQVSIEPEIIYEWIGGGPLLVGAWGPGPLGPLKSGPVVNKCFTLQKSFVTFFGQQQFVKK